MRETKSFNAQNKAKKKYKRKVLKQYMITVNFDNALEINVDERIIEDWRFVEAMSMMQDEAKYAFKAVNMLFGDDKDKLLDYIAKKNDGIAKAEDVAKAMVDAVNAIQGVTGEDGKNS